MDNYNKKMEIIDDLLVETLRFTDFTNGEACRWGEQVQTEIRVYDTTDNRMMIIISNNKSALLNFPILLLLLEEIK